MKNEKGYGIIELASDYIAHEGYVDVDYLQNIMKRDNISGNDVKESWNNDWDHDEWTENEIVLVRELFDYNN